MPGQMRMCQENGLGGQGLKPNSAIYILHFFLPLVKMSGFSLFFFFFFSASFSHPDHPSLIQLSKNPGLPLRKFFAMGKIPPTTTTISEYIHISASLSLPFFSILLFASPSPSTFSLSYCLYPALLPLCHLLPLFSPASFSLSLLPGSLPTSSPTPLPWFTHRPRTMTSGTACSISDGLKSLILAHKPPASAWTWCLAAA